MGKGCLGAAITLVVVAIVVLLLVYLYVLSGGAFDP